MIRMLVLILGLAAGLVVAVLAEGRMIHLRHYLPQAEPAWARAMTDDSGVFQGRLTPQPWPGLPVAAGLSWRYDRLTADGPVWHVVLDAGHGVSGAGDLVLLTTPGTARLEQASGQLALDQLPAILSGAGVGGLLQITRVRAEFDYSNGRLDSLNAALTWAGAQLDGQDLGTGEMQVVSGQGPGWRAPFSLTGDVVTATGTLQGRFGLDVARLDITIRDAGAMPDNWKRALDRIARRDDTGWTLRRDVTLTGTWPLL